MSRVAIAPDSFKGTISATAAAAALALGWQHERPTDELRLLPMADGGEGTLDAFMAAIPGARRMPVVVDGPSGAPLLAHWLLLPSTAATSRGTAVVELAGTSGIELMHAVDARSALRADTRGFGQAIAAALDHGVSRLVLSIGSSASTDGGVGALSALGASFLDGEGRPVSGGGGGLTALATADLSGLPPLPEGACRCSPT